MIESLLKDGVLECPSLVVFQNALNPTKAILTNSAFFVLKRAINNNQCFDMIVTLLCKTLMKRFVRKARLKRGSTKERKYHVLSYSSTELKPAHIKTWHQ